MKQKYQTWTPKTLKILSCHANQYKAARRIYAMKDKMGKVTHLTKEILARSVEYCSQLYCSTDSDPKLISDSLKNL